MLNSVGGVKIHVIEPQPRMTLSSKVPVTNEFRAEINLWMAGFFGFSYGLYEQGQAYKIKDTLFMRRDDYEHLAAAVKSAEGK